MDHHLFIHEAIIRQLRTINQCLRVDSHLFEDLIDLRLCLIRRFGLERQTIDHIEIIGIFQDSEKAVLVFRIDHTVFFDELVFRKGRLHEIIRIEHIILQRTVDVDLGPLFLAEEREPVSTYIFICIIASFRICDLHVVI